MTWILASTLVHQVRPPDLSRARFRRFGKLSRAYSPRSLNSELAVFEGASSEGPEQLFQFEMAERESLMEMAAAEAGAEGGAAELDDMKKRLKEMEDEAAALRKMQAKVEQEMGSVQGDLHLTRQIEKKWIPDQFLSAMWSMDSPRDMHMLNLLCLHLLTNLVMRSVRLMILILPKEGLPDLDPP
ncbi:polyadenylate-binding protein, partial [Striga asiatica]